MTQQRIKTDFPLSTLSHISEGYSAGAIKRTCETILTEFRVSKLLERELNISEFIGPLSVCACADKETNDEFKNFTDMITGDKARRDKERKEKDEKEGNKKDGEKQETKKKKKKK